MRDRGRLSFNVIPKGDKLRKLWLNKISRKGFNPKTSQLSGYRVCSEHFEGGRKTCRINVPLYFHLINHTEHKTLNHDNSLNGNLSVSTLKNSYENNEIDSILDKQDTQSQR